MHFDCRLSITEGSYEENVFLNSVNIPSKLTSEKSHIVSLVSILNNLTIGFFFLFFKLIYISSFDLYLLN